MTHQEKINFITKKAHEANPSILDLVFGCRIDFKGQEAIYINKFMKVHYLHFLNENLPPQILNDVFEHNIEILGREIRLADVLLAIGKESSANNYTAWLDDECFETPHFLLSTREDLENEDDRPLLDWNLLKDSLTDQSPETVDFIYQLLQ